MLFHPLHLHIVQDHREQTARPCPLSQPEGTWGTRPGSTAVARDLRGARPHGLLMSPGLFAPRWGGILQMPTCLSTGYFCQMFIQCSLSLLLFLIYFKWAPRPWGQPLPAPRPQLLGRTHPHPSPGFGETHLCWPLTWLHTVPGRHLDGFLPAAERPRGYDRTQARGCR